jgi:hypothetical protein
MYAIGKTVQRQGTVFQVRKYYWCNPAVVFYDFTLADIIGGE